MLQEQDKSNKCCSCEWQDQLSWNHFIKTGSLYCGYPNGGNKGISDTFIFSWDPFPPTRLPQAALIWEIMPSLILCHLFSGYPWEACTFLKRNCEKLEVCGKDWEECRKGNFSRGILKTKAKQTKQERRKDREKKKETKKEKNILRSEVYSMFYVIYIIFICICYINMNIYL